MAISMAKECTYGMMDGSLTVIGRITRCMVKVHSLGVTDAYTLASTRKTKRTVTVNSDGQTAGFTKAIGKMESSTEQASTLQLAVKKSLVNGMKERGTDGS